MEAAGFTRTSVYYRGEAANISIENCRKALFKALELSEEKFTEGTIHQNKTATATLREHIEEISKDSDRSMRIRTNLENFMKEQTGDIHPNLAEALRLHGNRSTSASVTGVARTLTQHTIEALPIRQLFLELAEDSSRIDAKQLESFKRLIDSYDEKTSEHLFQWLIAEIDTCKKQLTALSSDAENALNHILNRAKTDPEFKKQLPDIIEHIVYKLPTVRDELLYTRGLQDEIPENLKNAGAGATDEISKIVRAVRRVFLSEGAKARTLAENIADNDYAFQDGIARETNIAGSRIHNTRVRLAESLAGQSSCNYRTILTFDFERRLESGLFQEQCRELLKDRNLPEEQLTKEVNRITATCRKILYQMESNGFVAKFDTLGIKPNDGDEYKIIMQLLYNSELDSTTTQAIKKVNGGLLSRLKNYGQAVISQLGDEINHLHQSANVNGRNVHVASPTRSHLVAAKSLLSTIKENATNFRGTKQWGKIFGTAFLGLAGATLAADALIAHTSKKNLYPKGSKDVKFATKV